MKVGVIGAGAISGIYLKNMTEVFDNLQVVAISANHIENARKKADEFGIKACTTSEILANPEVEMVVVLTPVGSHYQLIKDALNAGKHVYTEKTITDDPVKARELLKLADEKGLGLASAPDTFMGAAIQTGIAAIDDGMLGDIHSFVISATRNNNILLSLFSFLRESGAGTLYDYGVYYLTALVSLLGPVARAGGIIGIPYPTHVNILPDSPLFGQEMNTPNESQVSAVIKLKSGVTGTFHIDCDTLSNDEAIFRIYGTKGVLSLSCPDNFGGKVQFVPNAVDYRNPPKPVDLMAFTPYGENSRGVGPHDLAEAIENGRPIRPSKEMAAHVLDVLNAILSGGENGEFKEINSTCLRPLPLQTKKAGVKNIGHVSFNMKNTDEMLHFYRDILGMKEQFTLSCSELAEIIKVPEGEDTRKTDEYKQRNDAKGLSCLKLADGQFIELFYPNNPGVVREIKDRNENYGYTKLNFETDDIEALYTELVSQGIESRDGIHKTVDGSTEFTVFDPDDNEVQFTQYERGEKARILKADDPLHNVCSKVKYTTQVAYQVKDVNMFNFYTKGLGMKHVDRLTYGDLAKAVEKSVETDINRLSDLKMLGDSPWIDYIEVGPHQYIELFYTDGQPKKENINISDAFGYQHICIEVENIHKAWDAVTGNGITPDTQIALGCDKSYRFWLTDPDGNRLEMMQYTDESLQIG